MINVACKCVFVYFTCLHSHIRSMLWLCLHRWIRIPMHVCIMLPPSGICFFSIVVVILFRSFTNTMKQKAIAYTINVKWWSVFIGVPCRHNVKRSIRIQSIFFIKASFWFVLNLVCKSISLSGIRVVFCVNHRLCAAEIKTRRQFQIEEDV